MARQSPDPKRNVFVVYGRNLLARNAVFDFLRALGLRPLEWSELIQMTGPTPYTGAVLQTGLSTASAVVVIFTPDDEGRLNPTFSVPGDPTHESQLTGQPRQNVLLEAGMALASFRDRTVIVEIGQLRPISDILGLHALRILEDSPLIRHDFIGRLRAAGCDVNRDGTDWLHAGNFDRAISAAAVVNAPGPKIDYVGGSRSSSQSPISRYVRRLQIVRSTLASKLQLSVPFETLQVKLRETGDDLTMLLTDGLTAHTPQGLTDKFVNLQRTFSAFGELSSEQLLELLETDLQNAVKSLQNLGFELNKDLEDFIGHLSALE